MFEMKTRSNFVRGCFSLYALHTSNLIYFTLRWPAGISDLLNRRSSSVQAPMDKYKQAGILRYIKGRK